MQRFNKIIKLESLSNDHDDDGGEKRFLKIEFVQFQNSLL